MKQTKTLWDVRKPTYRVDSMRMVNQNYTSSSPTVVSFFAGGGGSSTGYKMAGFRVLWANEFVKEAADTYEMNHPGTIVDRRDIRKISGGDVMAAIGALQIDVMDGSPPCQSFSMAGRREKLWGKIVKHGDGSTQRSDDLFFEYGRLLGELRPKVFVAENVYGLVIGKAKGFYNQVVKLLSSKGYDVEARVLDAQWLAVPQQRKRVIIVGVRKDIGIPPAFPSPLPYRYTVADAIPWIYDIKRVAESRIKRVYLGKGRFADADDVPAQTILASDHKRGFRSDNRGNYDSSGGMVEVSIERTCLDKEWDKLQQGQQSRKYFSLIRAAMRKPCPTVTASGGQNAGIATVVHPTEKRKFTIPELKRICSFPDDYELPGTFAQQWARLGNSVPPHMMRAIAEAVRTKILARIK